MKKKKIKNKWKDLIVNKYENSQKLIKRDYDYIVNKLEKLYNKYIYEIKKKIDLVNQINNDFKKENKNIKNYLINLEEDKIKGNKTFLLKNYRLEIENKFKENDEKIEKIKKINCEYQNNKIKSILRSFRDVFRKTDFIKNKDKNNILRKSFTDKIYLSLSILKKNNKKSLKIKKPYFSYKVNMGGSFKKKSNKFSENKFFRSSSKSIFKFDKENLMRKKSLFPLN